MTRLDGLLDSFVQCSELVREAVIAAERIQLVQVVGMGADGAETLGVDQIAEVAALRYLENLHPRFNILSEEVGFIDHGSSITLIVDPIDATANATASAEVSIAGTTEASHRLIGPLPTNSGQFGFPYYAFSVAAIQDGVPIAACVRNLPTGDLFTATRGGGTRLNGVPVFCEPVREVEHAWVALVRPNGETGLKAVSPLLRTAGRLRITGCTSLDFCLIASGSLHGFVNPNVHFPPGGGEKVVDYAGALLILEEAGGCASDDEGNPLPLEFDLQRRVTPFAAATPELLDALRKMIGTG